MPKVDLLERRLPIEAPPAIVFEFFTDPAKLVSWIGVEASLEPRPGGVFEFVMYDGKTCRGRYVEVERPRRLVFTWGWTDGTFGLTPGSSVVEVNLDADGDGTLLHMIHRGLVSEPSVEAHGLGWDIHFARLVDVARGVAVDPGGSRCPGDPLP
ncbi:MAG: SRPBCC domain-containing protein [Myxococcales bacterium]|nr:SRPBCC domain-containing protein [Myxococcales bacterium]MCB9549738.1 SRPBCC domain-containing protein [Myxococcales bacterium]